VLAKNKNLT